MMHDVIRDWLSFGFFNPLNDTQPYLSCLFAGLNKLVNNLSYAINSHKI